LVWKKGMKMQEALYFLNAEHLRLFPEDELEIRYTDEMGRILALRRSSISPGH